ncbi:CPBP family intramembrane glutamic endopeptidase [Nocardioides stalactiti]|uniref:CPBP family intramembrane glutamic endopeptidase n=1 Tax=Nocardioides stalactiti TaxID=2755356 RepID=UPI0015FFF7A4|nr:CPBP family intramembrane glutamic endopeptidase [Nocardioides stalactiti]
MSAALRARLDRILPKPLTHVVRVEGREPRAVRHRRRRTVAATSVVGAGLLGASLSTRPGSREFYLSTAAVAGVWTVGSVASGPLHLGWIETRDATIRRPLVTPVVTGIGAFGLFYAAALVARRIPVLDDAISRVLDFADEGDDRLVLLTTLANGLGEEVFFRGALYAALGEHRPVVSSTAVYALATTTTRNPALVLAAAVMGSLFGLQRRASGGIQAPTITHLTWSALMVRFLPPLFRRPVNLAAARSRASGTRRGARSRS